jgi:ferritin-like metal-binding protein YciE
LKHKKNSKDGFIHNLKDIYSAEKWLETNIMQPYWSSEEAHHNTASRFKAANLAELW